VKLSTYDTHCMRCVLSRNMNEWMLIWVGCFSCHGIKETKNSDQNHTFILLIFTHCRISEWRGITYFTLALNSVDVWWVLGCLPDDRIRALKLGPTTCMTFVVQLFIVLGKYAKLANYCYRHLQCYHTVLWDALNDINKCKWQWVTLSFAKTLVSNQNSSLRPN